MLKNYKAICPLCSNPAEIFFICKREDKPYHHCEICDLRFLNPQHRLTLELESKQYSLHQNRASDTKYQDFFRPFMNAIEPRLKLGAKGLDYGCGSDSALTFLLKKSGFEVEVYDPIYFPHNSSLEKTYDFIVCTETVEHFFKPLQEFIRLHTLLNNHALLAIMTLLVPSKEDFQSWHYRQDPTHVCFFSEQTFSWLRDFLGFKQVDVVSNRIIILQK